MNSNESTEKKTLRLFLALETAPEVRSRIAAIQQTLMSAGADVKWVKPENAHITLLFFGDVPWHAVERLKSLLTEVVRGLEPFELPLEGLGFFGPPKNPRVVWIKAADAEQKLARLYEKLAGAMREFVPPREAERGFTPHLTLGRARSARNGAILAESIRALESASAGTLHVRRMALFSSELTPAGPVYTLLHAAP